MKFELAGQITDVEVIAAGPGVRVQSKLRKMYGGRRWRKLKGIATVWVPNGALRKAELHWYEAHGVGKKAMKIKHFLDEQ
ncbi:MAG: hypothetical protein DMG15_19360 [Acidobacteria bacterium]|nr:MAG: hypothetical protein DMG15_19360 [Acidobacteriota bacterium]